MIPAPCAPTGPRMARGARGGAAAVVLTFFWRRASRGLKDQCPHCPPNTVPGPSPARRRLPLPRNPCGPARYRDEKAADGNGAANGNGAPKPAPGGAPTPAAARPKGAAKQAAVDGNEACARIAYHMSDVSFIYPITPATPMGEAVDQWASEGRKNVFNHTMQVGARRMRSPSLPRAVAPGATCGPWGARMRRMAGPGSS